jgi:hypothetical protein
MDKLLLLPPIAFLVILVFMLFQYLGFGIFSSDIKTAEKPGGLKAYACGEDVKNHKVAPDYSQFFPFAFFFTIIHVVALVVATVPAGSFFAVAIAAFYLVASAIGLFVLFRR